jgi:hypothetical protein
LNIIFLILAKAVSDKSCREKLNNLGQIQFFQKSYSFGDKKKKEKEIKAPNFLSQLV